MDRDRMKELAFADTLELHVVADPDLCGDEDVPETVPETVPEGSPYRAAALRRRRGELVVE